jgi:hypothetical protein
MEPEVLERLRVYGAVKTYLMGEGLNMAGELPRRVMKPLLRLCGLKNSLAKDRLEDENHEKGAFVELLEALRKRRSGRANRD